MSNLRIIAGKYAKKKLSLPPEAITRPTSNQIRESIFNLLFNYIDIKDTLVLDAFAGSGAMGIEALSRGAQHVNFYEKNSQTFRILKQNIECLGETETISFKRADILRKPYFKGVLFNLVFLDPPYNEGLILKAIKTLKAENAFADEAIIVCELDSQEEIDLPKNLEILKDKIYGSTRILILQLT